MADQSRWVLAFDDACSSCSRKAKAVDEASGGKLQIRSLLDPEVVEWRRATGHGDAWQPMLFRVAERGSQAFTGAALVLQMARILRPRRALRVVRLIAEIEDRGAADPGRRRFLRTATFAGVTLAGIGVAGKLAFAPNPRTTLQTGQLLSQRALKAGDPLLAAVLASEPVRAVAATHGRDAMGSTFVHASYAGTELDAVGFLLTPKSGPSRYVYAYFQAGTASGFKVMQLEIVPDRSYTDDSPFSGSARALAHDETVIGSATFGDGKVLSTSIGQPRIGVVNPYGENWDCFGSCFNNQWQKLPWWIKAACGLVCGACIAAPELAIPCGACIGCVGGYSSACFASCWR